MICRTHFKFRQVEKYKKPFCMRKLGIAVIFYEKDFRMLLYEIERRVFQDEW